MASEPIEPGVGSWIPAIGDRLPALVNELTCNEQHRVIFEVEVHALDAWERPMVVASHHVAKALYQRWVGVTSALVVITQDVHHPAFGAICDFLSTQREPATERF